MKKLWRLLGSFTLVTVLAWRLDWRQAGAAFARLDASLWLLALVLYVLIQVVSSVRWQLMARPLGFGGHGGRYLGYYFIGMFFNLLLPTSVGGDVVRAWYLAGMDGPAPATGRRLRAFLSVLADRASGLAVLVAVACVAAICCPIPLPRWIVGVVAAAGAAVVLGVLTLPVLTRLPALSGPGARLEPLAECAAVYLRHGRLLVSATVLSVVVQVANVVLVWLVGEALGLRVPPLYYGVMVPLVSLLTMLPISLNGMGLREAGTVVLLAPLGVSETAAVTLSVLTFSVFTAASLLGLGFYLFGRFPRYVAPPVAAAKDGPGVEGRCDGESVGGNSDQGRTRQPPAAA